MSTGTETRWPPARSGRYESSMTVKIAVSLPDHLVATARTAVAEGRAASVSAYVAAALEAYADDHRVITMLDEIIEQTGGPVTAAEQAWADEILRGR